MKKGTKESIVDASSDYLTDYLPDNYDTWTKEKLYKYLENNSWEPFENYSGEEIWEWIEDKAVWIDTDNKPTKEKIIYGYDLVERTKFEMSIEELCRINNNEDGLNSNCYIYTTEEDRDLHFEQNVENK
jgi:hypothetical protein|tara:strand:- start:1002 stop:1388 length:387 start_codon:yes stop_codon:yes gene_type:complete